MKLSEKDYQLLAQMQDLQGINHVLYPFRIQKLCRKGLVEKRGGGSMCYHLTFKGRKVLKALDKARGKNELKDCWINRV